MQLAAAHQAPALFQVQSGCVFEYPIGQEWTRSRIDPLLLPLAEAEEAWNKMTAWFKKYGVLS
jgi:hypothetical protein